MKSIRSLSQRDQVEIHCARLQTYTGGWCNTCRALSDEYSPYADPTGFLHARYEAIEAGACSCDTSITQEMTEAVEIETREPGDIPDCPF